MAEKPGNSPIIKAPKPFDNLAESAATDQVAAALTPDEQRELLRRVDAYRASRDPGEPAAQVIERLRRRYR
jgi:putative addiction module component (TIGR02574 family)